MTAIEQEPTPTITPTGQAWQSIGGLSFILKELHNRGDLTDYGKSVVNCHLDNIRQAMTELETKTIAWVGELRVILNLHERYENNAMGPGNPGAMCRRCSQRWPCATAAAASAALDLLPQHYAKEGE